MRILVVVQGNYGTRKVDNIRKHAPSDWTVEVLQVLLRRARTIREGNLDLQTADPISKRITTLALLKVLADLYICTRWET